jgi:hypothetical protein
MTNLILGKALAARIPDFDALEFKFDAVRFDFYGVEFVFHAVVFDSGGLEQWLQILIADNRYKKVGKKLRIFVVLAGSGTNLPFTQEACIIVTRCLEHPVELPKSRA